MRKGNETPGSVRPGLFARLCHWGFILFGGLAFLTGEMAEDYEGALSYGYYLHSAFGLGLAAVMLAYLLNFFLGKDKIRYKSWIKWDQNTFKQIKGDMNLLLRFKLPPADKHNGLAEAIQVIGILSFTFMSITGISIFLLIGFGGAESGLLKAVFNVHETFKAVALLYLMIHIGASILHTIAGHGVLGKIFSFKTGK